MEGTTKMEGGGRGVREKETKKWLEKQMGRESDAHVDAVREAAACEDTVLPLEFERCECRSARQVQLSAAADHAAISVAAVITAAICS